MKQAVRKIDCRRCGHIPSHWPERGLVNGLCIVCIDYRERQAQKARDWAIYRFKSIQNGTWYTEKQNRQLKLTEA